jgi:hypothetical protein
LTTALTTSSQRAVILAPQGRDARIAAGILQEGGLIADICKDLQGLIVEVATGAGVAVLTDDAIRDTENDRSGFKSFCPSRRSRQSMNFDFDQECPAEPLRFGNCLDAG